jgi:hypothetical protein
MSTEPGTRLRRGHHCRRDFRLTCPNGWCNSDSKMLELKMVVKFGGLEIRWWYSFVDRLIAGAMTSRKFQGPERYLAASKGVYE